MRTLTWKPILSNLTEASGELRKLHWRLHYIQFRELPEDCPRRTDTSEVDWYARQELRDPFDEGSLFVSLEHAYHHLNWAWNCRRTPEERVWHFSDMDGNRWSKFPDTADFADLWPLDRTVKEGRGMLGSARKVNILPIRIGIYMADRKLGILCRLVAKECLGEDEVDPPERIPADVWKRPLTEKAFARRMHRIYTELNIVWKSRRDKGFVTTKRAINRRRCFSPDFAAGCYNMWW